MSALIQYLKDVRTELAHVAWPTTSQAIGYTVLVVIISVLVAILLRAADLVFEFGLQYLIIN